MIKNDVISTQRDNDCLRIAMQMEGPEEFILQGPFSLHCDSLESKNDREEVSEANGFEAHY